MSFDNCYFKDEAMDMEMLCSSIYDRSQFYDLYEKFMEEARSLKSYQQGIKEKLESLDNEELSEKLGTNIDIRRIQNVKVEFEKDYVNSTTILSFEVIFKDGKYIEICMWSVHNYGESEYSLEYKGETYYYEKKEFKKLPKKLRLFFEYILEEIFRKICNDNEEFV